MSTTARPIAAAPGPVCALNYRVRLNSREQSYEEAWFVERTINFGGFRLKPGTDVFRGEPDVTLDLRHDLLRLGRRRARR